MKEKFWWRRGTIKWRVKRKNEKHDIESEDEKEHNNEEARKAVEEKSDEEVIENLLNEEQGVSQKAICQDCFGNLPK